MKRVRFKVPEVELLHTRAFLLSQDFTQRTWAEILLTYLCCPSREHPAVVHAGVTTQQLLILGRRATPTKDDISAYYELRWPESTIRAIDPGLELAELSFQSMLSILWAWTHSPELTINVNLAARLAAFASSFTPDATSWAQIRGTYRELKVDVSPHTLITLPDYDPRLLPWMVRIKGVTQ